MYKHAMGGSKFSAFKRDRSQKTFLGNAVNPGVRAAKATKADRRNLEPSPEPVERDEDTLDVGRGEIENKSLVWSVVAQVELRERKRLERIKNVKAAEDFFIKQKADRLAGKLPPKKQKRKRRSKKAIKR